MFQNRLARLSLWAAAGLVLAVVIAILLAFMPGGVELAVTPLNGKPALFTAPLKPGERFTVHYFHSVENAPIWEEHSVDAQGRIYIEEERYLKFGAGMGRMPGVGRMVMKGPYEAIVDMHMPVGDFVLRVGSPGVDHTIIWRDTMRNLSALAPHERVVFSARPVSALYALYRRLNPDPATPRL